MTKWIQFAFAAIGISLVAVLLWLIRDANDQVRTAALSALLTLAGTSLGFFGGFLLEVRRESTGEVRRKAQRFEEFIWSGLSELETEIDNLAAAMAHLASTTGLQTEQGSLDFAARESVFVEQYQRASLHTVTMAARLDDPAIFASVRKLTDVADAFVNRNDGGDLTAEYHAVVIAIGQAQQEITQRRRALLGSEPAA